MKIKKDHLLTAAKGVRMSPLEFWKNDSLVIPHGHGRRPWT